MHEQWISAETNFGRCCWVTYDEFSFGSSKLIS
ncbi:hypothetical protein AAZX31_17G059600 [Glycine max]|nr:hypothetical protein GLYMA_17G061550v4 [Glycine max]KAH1117064.1 hypothetical protein GYH30_046421 [Glycine max]